MKPTCRKSATTRNAALIAIALSMAQAFGAPPGPTLTIPEGGQPPGAYPNTSVSSANWVAKGGTADDGNVEMNLERFGPTGWSVSRYNRGDFAIRIGVRDQTAARSNLNIGFTQFDNSGADTGPGQAWAPHRERGILLPTARQNGPIEWPDSQGSFYPTIAASVGSSGNGYDMVTGVFDGGDSDVNTGKAGDAGEGNFNFATTWFPYDQGWLGGEIAPPGPEGQSTWTTPNAHAPGLAAGLVTWVDTSGGSAVFGGHATLKLPGVNSLEDGMVFTTSTDGNSAVNIIGVAPQDDGTSWLVTIREDSATDGETLASSGESEFEFLYIPYNATGLVGGYINGASGAKTKSAGDFTVARTGVGTYELTIPGKSGATGSLILQAAGMEPGTSIPLATRGFLSYEFLDGKFVIKSYQTGSGGSGELADVSFYVAYVDFTTPLSMPAGPRMRSLGAVQVVDETALAKETSVAGNSQDSEILVTYIDTSDTGAYVDPITQQTAVSALVGRFYNGETLAPIGDPFVIVGNPAGALAKNDVKYNPVSRQYVAFTLARAYNDLGKDVVLGALINPPSATTPGVAKTIVHHADTDEAYDDVSVAVSPRNGNFILLAERKFTGEGEGTVAAIYNQSGTLLTPVMTRVDPLQNVGDEDDPDVIYLAERDVFLYIANTDNSNGSTGNLSNRIVGSIIDTAPNTQGQITVRLEQPIANGLPAGRAEGHPHSVENPFNDQIITAYDAGNGTSTGELSYTAVTAAPAYVFSQAREEVSYLAGDAGNPFQHQHPQLAVETDHGVFMLGFNARASTIGLPDGYAFWLLGPDGLPLAGQFETPYYLTDAPGGIDHGVNFHTMRYAPGADSFAVAFSTLPGAVYLATLEVTSSHLQVEAPTLSISKLNGKVVITWPATASGFTLQSRNDLASGNWAPSGLTPAVENGNQRVELEPAGSARFFRLAQ